MARIYEGECMGRFPGDEPLTLTRCHSCELPQLYEALEVRLWPSLQLKDIKVKISFSFTDLLLSLIS